MRPISYEQFKRFFQSCRRAWHLELRDVYRVESEDIPFEKWRKGEPDDFAWLAEWLGHIRSATGNGVAVERLRVVSEPHTEYITWEMSFAHLNIASGEDIRYLSRKEIGNVDLPTEDCWLFDDDVLVLSLFKPDGRSNGFAVEESACLTDRYVGVRDQTWPRAVAHDSYAIQ